MYPQYVVPQNIESRIHTAWFASSALYFACLVSQQQTGYSPSDMIPPRSHSTGVGHPHPYTVNLAVELYFLWSPDSSSQASYVHNLDLFFPPG